MESLQEDRNMIGPLYVVLRHSQSLPYALQHTYAPWTEYSFMLQAQPYNMAFSPFYLNLYSSFLGLVLCSDVVVECGEEAGLWDLGDIKRPKISLS